MRDFIPQRVSECRRPNKKLGWLRQCAAMTQWTKSLGYCGLVIICRIGELDEAHLHVWGVLHEEPD